ncbi:hypothetical protein Lal_00015228 [Lupinus albus]|nr:hypothetical protein Lal_00015228 [Lupinus albus]
MQAPGEPDRRFQQAGTVDEGDDALGDRQGGPVAEAQRAQPLLEDAPAPVQHLQPAGMAAEPAVEPGAVDQVEGVDIGRVAPEQPDIELGHPGRHPRQPQDAVMPLPPGAVVGHDDQQQPARLQHAQRLVQHRRGIADMLQHVGGIDDVEAGIGEGDRLAGGVAHRVGRQAVMADQPAADVERRAVFAHAGLDAVDVQPMGGAPAHHGHAAAGADLQDAGLIGIDAGGRGGSPQLRHLFVGARLRQHVAHDVRHRHTGDAADEAAVDIAAGQQPAQLRPPVLDAFGLEAVALEECYDLLDRIEGLVGRIVPVLDLGLDRHIVGAAVDLLPLQRAGDLGQAGEEAADQLAPGRRVHVGAAEMAHALMHRRQPGLQIEAEIDGAARLGDGHQVAHHLHRVGRHHRNAPAPDQIERTEVRIQLLKILVVELDVVAAEALGLLAGGGEAVRRHIDRHHLFGHFRQDDGADAVAAAGIERPADLPLGQGLQHVLLGLVVDRHETGPEVVVEFLGREIHGAALPPAEGVALIVMVVVLRSGGRRRPGGIGLDAPRRRIRLDEQAGVAVQQSRQLAVAALGADAQHVGVHQHMEVLKKLQPLPRPYRPAPGRPVPGQVVLRQVVQRDRRELREVGDGGRLVGGDVEHRPVQRRPQRLQPVDVPGGLGDGVAEPDEVATADVQRHHRVAAAFKRLHHRIDMGQPFRPRPQPGLHPLPPFLAMLEQEQRRQDVDVRARVVAPSGHQIVQQVPPEGQRLQPARGFRIVEVEIVAADPVRRFQPVAEFLGIETQQHIFQHIVGEAPVGGQRRRADARLRRIGVPAPLQAPALPGKGPAQAGDRLDGEEPAAVPLHVFQHRRRTLVIAGSHPAFGDRGQAVDAEGIGGGRMGIAVFGEEAPCLFQPALADQKDRQQVDGAGHVAAGAEKRQPQDLLRLRLPVQFNQRTAQPGQCQRDAGPGGPGIAFCRRLDHAGGMLCIALVIEHPTLLRLKQKGAAEAGHGPIRIAHLDPDVPQIGAGTGKIRLQGKRKTLTGLRFLKRTGLAQRDSEIMIGGDATRIEPQHAAEGQDGNPPVTGTATVAHQRGKRVVGVLQFRRQDQGAAVSRQRLVDPAEPSQSAAEIVAGVGHVRLDVQGAADHLHRLARAAQPAFGQPQQVHGLGVARIDLQNAHIQRARFVEAVGAMISDGGLQCFGDGGHEDPCSASTPFMPRSGPRPCPCAVPSLGPGRKPPCLARTLWG